MKTCFTAIYLLIAFSSTVAFGQPAAQSSAPTLIPVSGQFVTAGGQARTGSAVLVLSLYEGKDDPAPRWVEFQTVTLDAQGRYDVRFGATRDDGLPADLFAGAGATRWVGVAVENEAEQPRVMLVSVPYAARAVEAETLAGRSAGDFMLASSFRDDLKSALEEEGVRTSDSVSTAAVTENFLQKGSPGGGATTDSTVFENVNGNVGIGVITPQDRLDVFGGLRLSGAAGDTRIRIRPDGIQRAIIGLAGAIKATSSTDLALFAELGSGISMMVNGSPTDAMTLTAGGNLGVGVLAPQDRLDIAGGLRLSGLVSDTRIRFRPGGTQRAIIGLSGAIKGTPATDLAFFAESGSGLSIMVNGSPTDAVTVTSAGSVGIGTATPAARLHVVGDATFTGNVVVDGNIAAKYQDVAEWVDAVEPLEAGTVVIIDPSGSNRVMGAAKAYESSVAGAVSPQPGLTLGEPGEGRVLVAQSGRVRVKADAAYGAIRAGDLLVTSKTKGYVMKSQPIKVGGQSVHRPGTLVGKALESLEKGQGEILVLLTLQ